MIGSRVGSRGILAGSAVGSSADDEGLSDPFAGVTIDSGLGWRLPNSAGEWATLKTGSGGTWATPNHLWLLQEAAGNPADTIGTGIGTRNLTATTAGAAPTYNKAVPGATRLFIGGAGGSVNCNLSNGSMVDTSTTSFAKLVLVRSTAATVLRNITLYGSPLFVQPASNKFRLRLGVNLTDSVNDQVGVVRLALVVYNIPATTATLYLPDEKVSVTFGASVGSNVLFQCSGTGDATVADFGYAAAWDGAAGEFSSGQAKNLMEALLGTTVPWS